MSDELGFVNGLHFTDYVEVVKDLKRQQQTDAAIALLQKLVDATEAEDREQGYGVAPWYYEQLAILYRKHGRLVDEVFILEQYAQQRKAPGVLPAKLAARLDKARELISSSMPNRGA